MKEIILLILAFTVTGHTAQYAAEEAALIADIKGKSNPEARPDNTTRVTASLELWDVNEIDIGRETMTITGFIYAWWTDERLAWNNSDIKRVTISAKHVWVPGLIIENELMFGSDKVGSQGYREGPLVVYRDGSVEWGLQVTTVVSCSANIAFYPFDKQSCFLILADPRHPLDEVELVAYSSKAIDLGFYRTNGEWQLLSTEYEHDDYVVDGLRKRTIFFSLNLRRRPTFYVLDIIVPLGLVSLLMTFVFLIPVEMRGEKIGYCIAVMLTFIVFLTIVSSQLPHQSKQVSIVQVYILIGLLTGTLSTLATIFVLILSEEDDVPDVGVMKQLKFCICRWFSRKRKTDTNKVASEPTRAQQENQENRNESQNAGNENQEHGQKKHKKRNKEKRKEEERKKEEIKLLLPKKVDRFFCYVFGGVFTISYVILVIILCIKYNTSL